MVPAFPKRDESLEPIVDALSAGLIMAGDQLAEPNLIEAPHVRAE